MSLLTMTDCADAGNRVQARHELDRAFMTVGTQAPADWAIKWGRALIDYADGAPSADDISEDLKCAEDETADARNESNCLRDAIESACSALDKIEASEEIRDAIDAAIANLENSL